MAEQGSPAASDTSVQERAVSLAHRMLAGAGNASVVAYRVAGQPVLDALAHGMTERGEILVAGVPSGDPAQDELMRAGRVLKVRVDISKLAPEPRVTILAASAHMLGTLQWLDDARAAELLSGAVVCDTVRAVAQSPRGVLGVVRVERVVLHDGAGVTGIPHERLAAHRPAAPLDELEAVGLDVALGVDPTDLAALCDAVSQGWVPAHLLSEKPPAGGCSHTTNQDYIVDVDTAGLTVLRTGAERTSVYFIPFGAAAGDDVATRVDMLFGTKVSAA